MKKFSIVIPTYNSESTIENAISSISQNKISSDLIEVIVVDDCSVDSTQEKVSSLSENFDNLRLFSLEENLGPGAARNKGITESTGNWILFLDSDDQLVPGALDLLGSRIDELQDDCELICFNWSYSPESNAPTSTLEGRDDLHLIHENNKDSIIKNYLLSFIDNSVIYSAFKKELFQEEKLLFRNGFHEDVDFMLRALIHAQKTHTILDSLYLKNNRDDSIVNTISEKHIDGYFSALEEIKKILESQQLYTDFVDDFTLGTVNIVSSRLMRIWQFTKLEEKDNFYKLAKYLHEKTVLLGSTLGLELRNLRKDKFRPDFKTKYQQIFEFFISEFQPDDSSKIDELDSFLVDISGKSWSCYDLQNSVFFAPEEIRTCCKRYFYDNQMKGDVVLFNKNKDKEIFDYEAIVQSKRNLYREINRDNSSDCKGCPFLKFEKWGKPLDDGIKYISLEQHSVCNMRCTYCSDTYYGGKKAGYDFDSLIDSIVQSNALKNCEYVVWGGGEPTIDKSFGSNLKKMSSDISAVKQRVITNSTIFSKDLADLLQSNKAYMITSIDAGTPEKFREVRNLPALDKVLSNLQAYSEYAPHNMIIKYILLPNVNTDFEELKSFVENIKKYDLTKCNFQISFNFKEEMISLEFLKVIASLYALLLEAKVRFLFLDDLIWQRLKPLSQKQIQEIKESLITQGLKDIIISPQDTQSIAVWGTGTQSELLLRRSYFLRNTDVDFFVDPREYKIGTKHLDKEIYAPEILKTKDIKVLIGAVQNSADIYTQYLSLNISQNNLIRELVL